MASHGMFATTDLIGPLGLARHQAVLQPVYRPATERPERLSLKVLMALLDILGCGMEDLIEPVAAAPARKAASGGEPGIGSSRAPGERISPAAGDRCATPSHPRCPAAR